jgi:hypothetical protein
VIGPKRQARTMTSGSGNQIYGNHIQASIRSLIVLGANNPTQMTTMPETTKETDKMVSGHPLRLRSKLWKSAFMPNLFHKLSECVTLRPVIRSR